jgi:hypothetical protein
LCPPSSQASFASVVPSTQLTLTSFTSPKSLQRRGINVKKECTKTKPQMLLMDKQEQNKAKKKKSSNK